MPSDVMEQRFLNIPSSAFIWSLILHVSVPFTVLTLQILDQKGLLPFPKKKIITQEAYQNFIQVDVVALPDNLINERKSIDTTLPIVDKPETTVEDTKTLEKEEADALKLEKDKEKAAAEEKSVKDKAEKERVEKEKAAKEKARKAEQENALKKLQQEAEREAALKAMAEKSGKQGRQKLQGNRLSKGTAMSGLIGSERQQYIGRVQQAIRDRFDIFPWQSKKGLSNTVYFELFPTGRVRVKKLLKRSKDPLFDSAVLGAIDRAQPLPVPEDMSQINDGFSIEFKPE